MKLEYLESLKNTLKNIYMCLDFVVGYLTSLPTYFDEQILREFEIRIQLGNFYFNDLIAECKHHIQHFSYLNPAKKV
jgi:hypothetical protein